MSNLIVHMLAEWIGPPDVRGDRRVFPKGWTGEMPEDWAGYCLSRDVARPAAPVPASLETGIALLREVVKHLVEARIEPTYKTVYDAVAGLAAAQSNDEGVPIPNADPAALTVAPIPAAPVPPAEAVPLAGDATAAAHAAATALAAPAPIPRRRGAKL